MIQPEGLHVSAIKRSEDGRGWIVRIFNPYDESQTVALRLNGGYSGPLVPKSPVERIQSEYTLPEGSGSPWQTVRLVSLEETPLEEIAMDNNGWVRLDVGRKKILTLEFLPEDKR